MGVLSSLVFFISRLADDVTGALAEAGIVDALETVAYFGVTEPSPAVVDVPLVAIASGSTIVDRRRLSPLSSPLEKVLDVFGLAASALVAIGGLDEPELGRGDALAPLPSPRMVLISWLVLSDLELIFEDTSLGV